MSRGPDPGRTGDFYVRQLRACWKFSAPIEAMIPAGMPFYARLCGWTLARAHALFRGPGIPSAPAAYLGGSARFDQAIAGFAETYADQNERDYAALQAAVETARPKPPPRSKKLMVSATYAGAGGAARGGRDR